VEWNPHSTQFHIVLGMVGRSPMLQKHKRHRVLKINYTKKIK
jgi:hypothetical protein